MSREGLRSRCPWRGDGLSGCLWASFVTRYDDQLLASVGHAVQAFDEFLVGVAEYFGMMNEDHVLCRRANEVQELGELLFVVKG